MFRFESGVSNKLYEKLMGKYESCPDDPMDKFSKGSLIQKLIFYNLFLNFEQGMEFQHHPKAF